MSGSYRPTIKILLALFIMAVAARVAFTDTSYFFWDESIYLMHGQLFAGHFVGYSETFLRPPLLPLLLSPLAAAAQLQSYEFASRILLALLNSLVVLPVFSLTKALFGWRQAVIAAIIVAFLPVHILNSRWVLTDSLGALLAFSAVAAFIIGFKEERKLLIYAGGLLAGLAVLMKFTNLLLIPLLPPLFFLHLHRKATVAVSLLLFVFAAVMAPYLAYSQMAFGSPFYTFERAWHVVVVVAEPDFAGPGFFLFLYLLLDSLGMLLVFLTLGVWGSVSVSVSVEAKHRAFLLYCMAVAAAYSFFIIGRGVAKPLGLEWEPERFLLLFILFAIPFISQGISLLALAVLSRHSARLLSFGIVAAAIMAVALVFMHSQMGRAYTPSIGFEDGLRSSSKDMGLYLKGIGEFACLGNCPPVAYYSGKKMSVYFSAAALAAANHSRVVVFDSGVDALPQYKVSEKFCSGSHCAYLMLLQ